MEWPERGYEGTATPIFTGEGGVEYAGEFYVAAETVRACRVACCVHLTAILAAQGAQFESSFVKHVPPTFRVGVG